MYFIIPPEDIKKLKKISLLLIYALFTYWLLLNGSALENWEGGWTTSILFYMVGVSMFLDISDKIPDKLKTPLAESIIGFLFGFVGFTVLFIGLHDMGWWFQGGHPLPANQIIPTLIFQGFIVSFSEEIIFRGIIFRYLYTINVPVAYIGSSAIFAVFHFAAYGGSVALMLIAFAMGLLLCYLVDRFNLGVAWAFHFAYNCGALYIIFF